MASRGGDPVTYSDPFGLDCPNFSFCLFEGMWNTAVSKISSFAGKLNPPAEDAELACTGSIVVATARFGVDLAATLEGRRSESRWQGALI